MRSVLLLLPILTLQLYNFFTIFLPKAKRVLQVGDLTHSNRAIDLSIFSETPCTPHLCIDGGEFYIYTQLLIVELSA